MIPRALLDAGFVTPEQARRTPGTNFRGLMLAIEGEPDSGKTEFSLSAPGPGVVLGLDRGFNPIFDNQSPPPTRRSDFAFKVIQAPTSGQAKMEDYAKHWNAFYTEYRKGLELAVVRTVVLDGDSDSWELQRLAEHGRLTGIFPQTRFTDVKAARKAMYNRARDSGKILIATNKLEDEYVTVLDKAGKPTPDPNRPGEFMTARSGKRRAQGFVDQNYHWDIRIRTLYRPHEWGICIVKCKANMALMGDELWGEQCNFESLVQYAYPSIPLKEWGY